MAKAAAAKAPVKDSPDTEEALRYYLTDARHGPDSRTAHMLNLALSALKWLILKGESDSLRLQAAKEILQLPPVQARLGAMSLKVNELHQHIHLTKGVSREDSNELAERIAGMLAKQNGHKPLEILQEFSAETPDNPLKTNENP